MSEASSIVPPPGIEQHVYLSYSSADRSWAQKLSDALERRGVEIFLDQSRLMPGSEWLESLSARLRLSQYLLVLWSENARRSDWVQRELNSFAAEIERPSPEQSPYDRRVIFLTLEG